MTAKKNCSLPMLHDIEMMLNKHYDWMKDQTSVRQVKEGIEITTPYLDQDNDYVYIYVKSWANGFFTLTDDGYTIIGLEQQGCKFNSPGRKKMLNRTLNGFGVHLAEKALQVNARRNDFGLRMVNLIQAMLAVGSLCDLVGKPASNQRGNTC